MLTTRRMRATLENDSFGKLRPAFEFRKIVEGKSTTLELEKKNIFRNETFTSPDSIIVSNYGAMESSLWTISAPSGWKIMIQFDQEHGFAIEYHRRCFYDKLFIINKDRKSKFARLCGPKSNQSWPYDALRKISPLRSDSLEIWDVPFDTNSNLIYIAFDSDQSYHFRGFKLNFWFEKTKTKLNSFREGINFLKDQLLAIVRIGEFKTNGARVVANRVRGISNSMIRSVATGMRHCTKGPNHPAPCKHLL